MTEPAPEALEARWEALRSRLAAQFRQTPGIEGVLFLIGVQASGEGYQPQLPKERKQALVMEGACHAFEALGLYRRRPTEAGFAWEPAEDGLPPLSIEEQETLLKQAILAYFDGPGR